MRLKRSCVSRDVQLNLTSRRSAIRTNPGQSRPTHQNWSALVGTRAAAAFERDPALIHTFRA
jgi:hypothetical protein